MANKHERQETILELIERAAIGSQEELRQQLAKQGLQVTQGTLSRDLRELGIVRVPMDEGARYVRPERLADDGKPHLQNLLPQLISRIDGVGELLVLRTLASGAQPVAEAIDSQGWPEILGSLAGENTVLIVCRSAEARQQVADRLTRFSASGPAR